MPKDTDKSTKSIDLLEKDIASIKQQIKEIDNKIDLILEILNNFTLMVLDEEEAQQLLDDEEYGDDDGWIPEQNESWNSYDDDEEDI